MRELPSGTVTFLFTDIEGSTRLIDELGEEGYVEALTEHRTRLREAFGEYGGVEVDTQGDAFFYAFAGAGAAAAAAEQGQRALASGSVRVRMGLHTGEPLLTGEGYAGRELHRAARIAAAGHGGQVVVSETTAALVHRLSLRDLGSHRLKDLLEPIRLYQLEIEGQDGDFPPLRSLHQTNLPLAAWPIVGRELELEKIRSLLSEGVRLVTLTGPGGSGKTRLALQAAAELSDGFAEGVFFVALAPLRQTEMVRATVAEALGLQPDEDVIAWLGSKRALLVLDNLEHLAGVDAVVGELLVGETAILSTSRTPLRLSGERELPVEPLPDEAAVALFVSRAAAAGREIEADDSVVAVCRRLDNLPLALELAAARSKLLSPAALLQRLDSALPLLTGGASDRPERQRTLRATIEWSHNLLAPDAQTAFRRLSVFRGSFTLDAAEAVAGAGLDPVATLLDQSLLKSLGDDRFFLLETLREYAGERLVDSGEEAELRQRHALFFLAASEAAMSEIQAGNDQPRVLEHLEAEQDNLRAALEWARDEPAHEILLRLAAGGVSWHWLTRGSYQELDMWLSLALERSSSPVRARMEVLRRADNLAAVKQDWERSGALVEEWRTLAEREGDERQILLAMNAAAADAMEKGELDAAQREFLAILNRARKIEDPETLAFATINLGQVRERSGDESGALAYYTKALELFREQGDTGGETVTLLNCGWMCLVLSEPERAESYFREGLALADRLGRAKAIAEATQGLALTDIATGNAMRGAQLLGAAAAIREDLAIKLSDEEQQADSDAHATARAMLGDESFEAAWARGHTLKPEQIIEPHGVPTS